MTLPICHERIHMAGHTARRIRKDGFNIAHFLHACKAPKIPGIAFLWMFNKFWDKNCDRRDIAKKKRKHEDKEQKSKDGILHVFDII